MLPGEADAAEAPGWRPPRLRRTRRRRTPSPWSRPGALRRRRRRRRPSTRSSAAARPSSNGPQHVGAQMLDRLERADRLAELDALLGVVDRQLERACRRRRHRRRRRDGQQVECATDRRGRVPGAESPGPGTVERDRRLACGCRRRSRTSRPVRPSSRWTANTPSSPSGSCAVTRNRSAALPSATWALVPSSRHTSPSTRAAAAGVRHW